MRLCVYCGASSGTDPAFGLAAQALGQAIAQGGHELIYGGGKVGLMGQLASAVLGAGGSVTGVITHHLAELELAHPEATRMLRVGSMHERKAAMMERADAFIALPGGYGTLEELFEVLTWQQLGLHSKPVGLLNVADFWTPLLQFLDHTQKQRFISEAHRQILLVGTAPEELIQQLSQWRPEFSGKWI